MGTFMTPETHQTLVTRFAALFEQSALLQTHISSIVITPEYVYKFKKPVDFGFLDYTSLSKRRHFCEEEVRLGSLGANGLYTGVIPLFGSPERPALRGDGNPIEYAVCMHPFDGDAQLDRLLDSGRLDTAMIDAIALRLAHFHRDASLSDQDTPFGTPETVLRPMLENLSHLDSLPGKEAGGSLETLRAWIMREHARLSPLMDARKKRGHIRECHGDLHLRNMALWRGEVIFFDPIEFNEHLRHIDTISDLAFLLMDLEGRGKEGYARRLLSLYLEESGDYGGVTLLRLYKVYRAMVRAKVAALRLTQQHDPRDRETTLRESRSYLKLALSFLRKSEPFLALMHGFSGSGKSAAALALCERTGAIRLRSDRERLRLFDDPAGRYSADATEKTYKHLEELARALLQEGAAVVVDATFLRRDQRALFARLAEELGVRFAILHTAAPQSLLYARLGARERAKNDISEATRRVLRRQLMEHDPLENGEKRSLVTLHTSSPQQMAADMETWVGSW